MPLITFAHGEHEIERLVQSLRDLVDQHPGSGGELDIGRLPSREELRTDQAVLPREAFFGATESVSEDKAVGRVSAELITPYPPGIPALAPGEVITQPIVDYLEEIVAAGAFLEGAADQALDKFRVVTG